MARFILLSLVIGLFVACGGDSKGQSLSDSSATSYTPSPKPVLSPTLGDIWDSHTEAEQQQACSASVVTPGISLATCRAIFLAGLYSFPGESAGKERLAAIPTPIETSAPTKVASEEETSPTAIPTAAPIIFSDEQASAFLLKPNDFPNNWIAKKNDLILDAQNDYLTDYNVQKILITLTTHETEAAAQAAFSAKKAEAQTTIDGRGISGDKLEDVKKYPLFVWNASPQANMAGVEKWTVIGVYGNITVKVYNEGSMGAPKKGFAVDIAKKQIDRIKGG